MKNIFYSDINNEFTLDRNGHLKIEPNVNSINNCLNNLFKTIKGERVMRPALGSDLQELLFEPMVKRTEYFIRLALTDDILNYEDRINLVKLDVKGDPDKN